MAQGKIYKAENGRWRINVGEDDWSEWTSGVSVEVYTPAGWLRGRFESVDGEYYIILWCGLNFFPMPGTLVRRPRLHSRGEDEAILVPKKLPEAAKKLHDALAVSGWHLGNDKGAALMKQLWRALSERAAIAKAEGGE